MARPRKSERDAAGIRLANAFWTLLEHHRLANITVGMVAEQAELNRGTFYYHFKSMDDLIDRAIEDEVLGNGSILQNMLSLVAGSSTANGFEAFIKQDIERIALLIKQGGMDSFSIKIKCLMFGTWKAILCDEGEELSPSTRMIIEYSTSGVIGIIAYGALHGSGEVPPPEFFPSFAKSNSDFLVRQIGIAQGIPHEAVLERVRTTLRIAGMNDR